MASPAAGDDEDVLDPVRRPQKFGAPLSPNSPAAPMAYVTRGEGDATGERRLRTEVPPHWVRPSLVVEVEYRQRLKSGLRHAALKGLRPEKKPGVIRRSPLSEHGPS